MRRVAVFVLVVALLVGTATAFAVTESLKLDGSPLTAPRLPAEISPDCACPKETGVLSFRIPRPDRLDLAIVSDGKPVRTLASDLRARTGRVSIRWDGRDDAGAVVPAGSYRLRVHLDKANRTIVIPEDIEVVPADEAAVTRVLG